MGAFMAILTVLLVFQALCSLWMLVSAYRASFGWFFYMLFIVFGGGALFLNSLGPAVGGAIVLGSMLVFVVKNWQEVRTPFLLLVASVAIHAIVVGQAERTLAEQAQQATVEQGR